MLSRNPTDLLIVVALVIVGGVGAAWFWLRDDATLVPKATAGVTASVAIDPLPAERFEARALEVGNVAVELELAQLALDAGQYLDPLESSALTHYLNALGQDPGNPEAVLGIETVVRLTLDQVEQEIAGDRLKEAARLLGRLDGAEPEDPRFRQLTDRLAELRDDTLEEAQRLIADGNFDAAEASLKRIDGLEDPGAARRAALRKAIAEGRRAAERQVRQQAQQRAVAEAKIDESALEKNRAIEALVEQAHAALDAGRLLEPEADSARRHIGELEELAPEHAGLAILKEALLAAIVERATGRIEAGDLEAADRLLADAARLGGGSRTDEARNALVARLIADEGQKTIPASQLEIVRYVPPEYPNLAVRRKVEGWIEIAFVVTDTGETRGFEVLGGEKDAYFKNAAIEAVSQWQFKPRVIHGQPIAQRVSAKLTFQFE